MIDFKEPEILEFSRQVSKFFQKNIQKKDYSDLDNFPLNQRQALYILNWSIPAVTYSKGIEDLLGYSEFEFDHEKALTFLHPEDLELVNRITRATVAHCSQHKNVLKSFLNMTYRIKKKDGTYIKVLRQSGIYLCDEQGRLIANYSLLTDISFMNHSNAVDWEIEAADLDKQIFHDRIYEAFQDFFTCREKEIIMQMVEGKTTSQMAEKLFLSPHTVSTHRKNILRKSNCRSKEELNAFCIKNGIL